MQKMRSLTRLLWLAGLGIVMLPPSNKNMVSALVLRSSRSSSFVAGAGMQHILAVEEAGDGARSFVPRSYLVMRKQKASDKRTRRRQRGLDTNDDQFETRRESTLTQSPMQQRGRWKVKKQPASAASALPRTATKGRGRSRKRSNLYASLSFYYDKFSNLLTREYKAEEKEVIDRIEASVDNPLDLERAGFALFDMYPTRRGNLYSDEVYRLTKARDTTTSYSLPIETTKGETKQNATIEEALRQSVGGLPPNHKFSVNDVIVITRQPRGSGDLFDSSALPTSETAQKFEARVSGVGPTYVDIVAGPGAFEAAFGRPAPNDDSGNGDRSLRVRADLFFSPIPYQRMVTALAQITQVPPPTSQRGPNSLDGETATPQNPLDRIAMDSVIRDMILATHAFSDKQSPFWKDPSVCNLDELSNRISKPPMQSSARLAAQTIKYMQSNPQIFRKLNTPQLAAVEAALTRRSTLVHGPPGTGKTTVAAAIGFGFVHQCRNLSVHTKVLACAFSNVGADNLAEALLRLGLKVVRIGKPSAVSQSLWDYTIDAAIDRDPDAQKSLQKAAVSTAALAKQKLNKFASKNDDRMVRAAATSAVKASIAACNLAATQAFREADVIVSTSTGAADPRLMAACGLSQSDDDLDDPSEAKGRAPSRHMAPDGLPPLSLPFVMIDEACQSVEPASLIPVVSSNSCRALVLLGDPCQLPPTVRHAGSEESELSVSLMDRLARILPRPEIHSKVDTTSFDTTFLDSHPLRQARSIAQARNTEAQTGPYRKRFSGSYLLSIQYRMHPGIASFPSAIFYGGLLSTPRNLAEARSCPTVLNRLLPYGGTRQRDPNVRVVHIGGRNNERRKERDETSVLGQDSSYSNPAEAEFINKLLSDIMTSADRDVESIAVISPYNAQVRLIKTSLSKNADLMQEGLSPTVEISSVDAFQGRERDLVIFSAVRSNHQDRIGFLEDWRRLNVALSRAKRGLIIVGDFDTLAPANGNWAALQKWASGTECMIEQP